ncbi:MAG: transcription elongation factor GreA [Patescibacteria group bacterium]
MAEQKEYLTKEKYEELRKELEFLKKDRRKEIAESLEYAKSLGDLSENAEYHEARETQATTEDRIRKIEEILKSAQIVDVHHSERVDVGSVVHVRKGKEKEILKYQIVGSEEADTREGKISHKSPLGEALMGRKKGESFSFKTPKGEVEYGVVEIE